MWVRVDLCEYYYVNLRNYEPINQQNKQMHISTEYIFLAKALIEYSTFKSQEFHSLFDDRNSVNNITLS